MILVDSDNLSSVLYSSSEGYEVSFGQAEGSDRVTDVTRHFNVSSCLMGFFINSF